MLNTGHHWWKESRYPSDLDGSAGGAVDAFRVVPKCSAERKYPRMVDGVAQFIRNNVSPQVKLFFVTSPPGYPDCDQFSAPVNNVALLQRASLPWDWLLPLRNEHHWKKTFAAHGLSRYQHHWYECTAS